MSQFLLQLHNLHTLTKPSKLQSIPTTCFSHHPNLTTFPQKPTIPIKLRLSLRPLLPSTARFPIIVCKSNGSGLDFDVLSQPEEREGKPHRRANGIFWIILANIGIYLADHVFQARTIKMLYLYHNWPTWYQFLTATFCHANWSQAIFRATFSSCIFLESQLKKRKGILLCGFVIFLLGLEQTLFHGLFYQEMQFPLETLVLFSDYLHSASLSRCLGTGGRSSKCLYWANML